MAGFNIENGTLMRYEGRGGKVVVPCGVKHIAFAAFANSEVTEVVLPRGVESVDVSAFMGCEALRSIKIGFGLKKIGGYAFQGCGLESVFLPASTEEIGYAAFAFCESLKFAKTGGAPRIVRGVFQGCENLQTLAVCPRCEILDELPATCNVVRR